METNLKVVIIVFSLYLLQGFYTNNNAIENIDIITNASHHLYPYTASLITLALLIILVVVIATEGYRLNNTTD